MRISWLMPNLHMTGGARVAIELANRLVDFGHEFNIIIPAGRNRFLKEIKANVIECGIKVRSPLLAVASAMFSVLGKLPAGDVLIASMPPFVLLAKSIGKERHIPVANYLLNDDVHFFDDGSHLKSELLLKIYRTVANKSIRSKTIFVNSHWTAVQCVAAGGEKPAAFIPHGYDPEIFYPGNNRKTVGETRRLVTVGREEKWKGFADLINALNRIDIEKFPFELKVISQKDIDLCEARFPVQLVKPDSDQELAAHYRWGDIFIHSSWFEGFGMPPLEAQACGLAIVSTDSGGVREFLNDKKNALITLPRDIEALAGSVSQLIHNAELRESLILNGLNSCRDFTWDNAAGKFEDSIRKLTAI